MKFGRFVKKRKNTNPTYGDDDKCKGDDTYVGVDLNRNWGFGVWQDALRADGRRIKIRDPCSQVFQGPYPFSEPETRAARDFILGHVNQLKFVADYHSYGNEMLEPLNSMRGVTFKQLYPDYDEMLHELMAEGHPPKGDYLTTAPSSAMGYNSPGEMSDWITAATGIPAVSPEIGTNDPRTATFFIEDLDVIVDTLDQNYPLIFTAFKKIGYQLDAKVMTAKHEYDGTQSLVIEWTNKGMTDTNDRALVVVKSPLDADEFVLGKIKAFDRDDDEESLEIIELPYTITHSNSK